MNFHNSHVEENPLPPGHREKLELKQEFKICLFNLHSMLRGERSQYDDYGKRSTKESP